MREAGEHGVAGLIHDASVASKLPIEDHGLEWEFIACVAVGMVALKAQVGLSLSDVERLVLGIPKISRPCVKVIRIPKEKKSVHQSLLCVPEYKDNLS
mmetsp:Transcript_5631/g.8524  ORF Transcript_5631/g.8524 Transcript_5631/m.8524 type:complete len:98 (-) Transcript_5631:27-320(-)